MKISSLLASSALIAAGIALNPSVAFAADQAADAAPAKKAPKAETKEDADIIVTGTRVRRSTYTSFEPIVTLDSGYIQEEGITNIADAINGSPSFRGSITPNGTQGSFGQGVNFANNFGLGSNRTLTLVNGERFVSSNPPTQFGQASGGSQVDLNVIPSILVDRVDTISVGGSPVYGSDAISGTVNVILKTRYKGLLVEGTTGVTEQGDNGRYNLSALGGFDFNDHRGNITFSFSRDNVNGVPYSARDFLAANLGNATNPTAAQAAGFGPAGRTPANDGRIDPNIGFNISSTDGIPGSIAIRNLDIYYLTQGGLITGANAPGVTQNYQFNNSGNLVPFNKGILFPSIYSSGGDGFKFSDYTQITSDLLRNTGNLFLNYDFSSAAKFYFEGTYFNSEAHQLTHQGTFNSNLFGGSSGPITVDISNPFLTPASRATLTSLGVTRFSLSRASVDLSDQTGRSSTDLYRGVAGLKGDFNVGDHKLFYQVSANYGRTDLTDFTQDLNRQNFINAVNVTTNGAGQIVCTATPTYQAAPGGAPIADPNCQPLNLLGLNQASAAAKAYVIQQNVTKSRVEQTVFNANVGGDLFKIFGNSVPFNVGVEHRVERGSFLPSDFEQQGLGRSVAIAPTKGSYNVNEAFGEVVIPLVSKLNNLAFLQKLELFGRGRYVKNSVNGGFFSWAAGGTFSPVRDIEFRGNFTRSFRAPSIIELYLPQSAVFSAVPDLCSPGNINSGNAPTTRKANCLAFLAKYPNATPLDAAAATVPALSGGNPNLKNEVSYSFTYGVIARPRFIPGLTVAADYVNIHITNPITNLSATTIASSCFDNANFNAADPANGNAFCSLLHRYPTGTAVLAANGGSAAGQVVADAANPGVIQTNINGNQIKFSGIQGTATYRHTLAPFHIPGDIELAADALYVMYRLSDITGVAPVRSDGLIGDPKIAAVFNVRYIGENFGIHGRINFTGKQLAAITPRGLDYREFDSLKPYNTYDLGAYVEIQKRFRLNFEVINLLNRNGEKFNGVLFPLGFSDLLGRRATMSFRAKF